MASVDERSYISCALYETSTFLNRVISRLRFMRGKIALCAILAVLPMANAFGWQSKLPDIERQALADLYNSTNGSNWINNSNWIGSPDPCAWDGVYCEFNADKSEEHVTKILLPHNNLIGSIPSSIGNLSSLTTLDLSENKLSGSIPSSIGNLSSLTTLDLSENELSGSIPSSIGNLSSLITLELPINKLSGSIPSSIGNLSSLQYLELNANDLSGAIPNTIGNLTNLHLLNVAVNQLSSIPDTISNLIQLDTLALSNNKFVAPMPSSLWTLGNLKYLYFSYNPIGGNIPSEIGNLSNIEFIDLSCDNLEGAIPVEIGNLHNLLGLQLSGNNLTSLPSDISNDAQLVSLDLSFNKIASLPNTIADLSSLKGLDVTSNDLIVWPALPPSLIYLDLFANSLRGPVPIAYANLTNLQYAFVRSPDVCLPEKLAYWTTLTINTPGPLCDSGQVNITAGTAHVTADGGVTDDSAETTNAYSDNVYMSIPLGSLFYIKATRNDDGYTMSGNYVLGPAEPDATLPNGTLFPDSVALEFNHQTDNGIWYFRAVHLGKGLITIFPSDADSQAYTSPWRATLVKITVTKPTSLGSSHNQYDQVLIDYGNERGIPPHYLKGQMKQESGFKPRAYRYEPFYDVEYVSVDHDIRNQSPYSWYRLETIDGLTQGADLIQEDISSRNNYSIIDDTGTLRNIRDSDVDVYADNIYENNSGTGWSSNPMATLLRSNPNLLHFTAQTTLAASYGLMQVMYPTAISPMHWAGVAGQKNPSYLFDCSNTGETNSYSACDNFENNLAEGHGTIDLGSRYLVKEYNYYDSDFPVTETPNNYVAAFIMALNGYNGGNVVTSPYGSAVIQNSSSFLPVPSSLIFPYGSNSE